MSVLVAILVFAWVAIALLGLALGGLLARVHALEARLGPRLADPARVTPRLASPDAPFPSGQFAVAFVNSTCEVCEHALTELLGLIGGDQLIVATDEPLLKWQQLPASVQSVVDPDAVERSGVPAVPWFAAVDGNGHTTESFALGNAQAISRAARIAHELSAGVASGLAH